MVIASALIKCITLRLKLSGLLGSFFLKKYIRKYNRKMLKRKSVTKKLKKITRHWQVPNSLHVTLYADLLLQNTLKRKGSLLPGSLLSNIV